MRRSKRRERAEATVTRLRPISAGLFLLTMVVIMAIALPLTIWQYGIAGNDPAQRLDAIKVGLNVATLIGGASALLLAFRRQRSTEIIATETREAQEREYEQRDRAADAIERDAEQRRITELYTRAVDQLGNGQAPVRLGGLHALERLAQTSLDQRQTIVDVICAYLRMPYKPSEDRPPAEDATAKAHTRYKEQRQELQVRLTAQRILVAHLRPDSGDAFWPGIDLDLTQAYLHTFDLTNSQIWTAEFNGAQFAGEADFSGTNFDGATRFKGARFSKDAAFDNAHFHGTALFDKARFGKYARFESAHFHGVALFSEMRFGGEHTVFNGAHFDGGAVFTRARFGGYALFRWAHFIGGDAWFNSTRFTEGTHFDFAEFAGYAWFDKAQFAGYTWFEEKQFSNGAGFSGARVACGVNPSFLPTGWTTRAAQPAEGEKEGWLYVIRVENKDEQQPYQEDRSDSEAGTSGT